jgi:hypothetical protein
MKKLVFALLFSTASVFGQVTLPNGRVIPKDSFIVYLFLGHSNMAGRDKSKLDTVSSPSIWNFQLDRPPLQTWVRAKEPIHFENPPAPEFGCGPGISFLKAVSTISPGYYLGILQNANSHYCIATDYRRGKAAYTELVGAAQTFRGKVTFGGIVAMLGWVESEGEYPLAKPAEFAMQESCMVEEIRADLQTPNLPYAIGEFELGATSARAKFRDTITQKILTTPSILRNSAIVSSVGLTYTDDHHYDCASQSVWGQRAFGVFRDSGWLPTGLSAERSKENLRTASSLHEFRPGDEVQLFDATGRRVGSGVVGASATMPGFTLRGIYMVRHLRQRTVIATARRYFF